MLLHIKYIIFYNNIQGNLKNNNIYLYYFFTFGYFITKRNYWFPVAAIICICLVINKG